MHLILFGFPGSGKTHLGKKLAETLQRPFIDTDDLLIDLYFQRAQIKCTVRQIHQQIGEAAFRLLEQEALQSLSHQPPSIVALGGGAVLLPQNVAFLRTVGQLIYLKVPFELACERLLSRGIPSFADPKNPKASLKKLYKIREPLYHSLSTLQVPDGI